MKLSVAIFVCFLVAISFIALTLFMNVSTIYKEQLERTRLAKIQNVCNKKYLRERKTYVPQRSIFLAQKVINELLKKKPITFEQNSFSLELDNKLKKQSNHKKQVLTNIVAVVNNVKDNLILSITAYTDSVGSAQRNLYLSQKRADEVKAYFLKRVNVVLIVAIGYGEALPLTSRRIEINLKRIKQ